MSRRSNRVNNLTNNNPLHGSEGSNEPTPEVDEPTIEQLEQQTDEVLPEIDTEVRNVVRRVDTRYTFSLVRDMLKANTIQMFDGMITNKHVDIDDWFDQFHAIVEDLELNDFEMIHLLKNLMKGQALMVMRTCSGKPFSEYKRVLIEKFRGPGAKWVRLSKIDRIVQIEGHSIVRYYDYLTTELNKVEMLMKAKQPEDFKFPEQFKIHKFIKGLTQPFIRERLCTEDFAKLEDYYHLAINLEQSNPFGNRVAKRQREPSTNHPRAFKRQKHFNHQRNNNNFNQQKSRPLKQNNDSHSHIKCYGCQEMGHYKRNCPKSKSNFNAVQFTLSSRPEEEIKDSGNMSTVYAKVEGQVIPVLIDSGAAFNCISSNLATQLGIKQLDKVKCPLIVLPTGNTVSPIGMTTLSMKFVRDIVEVKFLVINKLAQDCILGADGQIQLKVRLDWEQSLVRFNGEPVPMNRSLNDAKLQLGSMATEAFPDKFKEPNAELSEYSSIVEDENYSDPIADKYAVNETASITIGKVNKQQENRVWSLINRFKNLFRPVTKSASKYEHKIVLTDDEVVKCQPYRVSNAQKDVMVKEVDKMLKDGTIRKSSSPYASPVILVPKPDGTWRFCVDYTRLNKKTKSDNYPIPNTHSRLAQLHGSTHFAKFDLYKGFWQIPLAEESKERTAFTTPMGLFEFNVLPMGLKTSPATFQRMMDDVLGDLIDHGVLVYLDDILVYGTSFEELLELTELVFKRLEVNRLFMKASKCSIGVTEIDYLGFVVSDKGIQPEDNKVKIISYLRLPNNIRQVRRFLGITGYYRNFIQNFSTLAAPLNALLKKSTKFTWTHIEQTAFEALKQALTNDVVLKHPNLSKPFTISTDASNYGVGAVLVQSGRPVWFSSRSLNPLERKYDTREKEAIGIRFGLDKFKPYYYPNHVTVYNDHGNLRWLMEQKQTGRLARWQLDLQQYDFTIGYVKGNNNPVADCLSRDIDEQVKLMAMITRSNAKARSKEVIKKADLNDLPFWNSFNWSLEQSKDKELQIASKSSNKFILKESIVYRLGEDKRTRMVIPSHLIDKTIEYVHRSVNCSHGGTEKTSYHLRGVWFKGFGQRIKRYVRSCLICLQTKGISHRNNVLRTRPQKTALSRVFMDIVGPLPNDTGSYDEDYRHILTIMDDNTRFARAIPLYNKTEKTICSVFLNHWVAVFGYPKEVIVDNGKQLCEAGMQKLIQHGNGTIIPTAPYSPEQNAVERFHRSLMQRVRALQKEMSLPWNAVLPLAVHGYNVTIHSMTNCSPFAMLFALDSNTLTHTTNIIGNIAEVRETASARALVLRKAAISKINKTRTEQSLNVGDKVYIKNYNPTKLDDKVNHEQYVIVRFIGNKLIKIKDQYDKQLTRSRKDVHKLDEL